MLKELSGDYKYKYDLLRTLVLELIHYGQKLQPLSALSAAQNASERIFPLFIELLEQQLPITTTEIISKRIIQEAKILLKQTHWSVADIAYTLGFDDPAHFSNYFKKQTSLAPLTFLS